MVKLTCSLTQWLWDNHKELIGLITLDHTELFTPEMEEEYIAWCQTPEGQEYLFGGKYYKEA